MKRVKSTRVRHVLLSVICSFIFMFLVFPIFIVIPMSFSSSAYLEFPPRGFSLQWYQRFFSSYEWKSSMVISLRVALATTVLATTLGTLASFSFVRGRFRGKQLLYPVIISPMVIPSILFAIACYFFFAKLRIIGSEIGLVIAHTVLAIPFVVINVSASLKSYNVNLERAALNLGANPIQAFFRITLPSIRPGIVAGALFAFITSFDEIVVAMFISGVTAVTLPKRMLEGIRTEINPTISAVSTMEIIAVILILMAVNMLQKSEAQE